jgi:hypothetical protein
MHIVMTIEEYQEVSFNISENSQCVIKEISQNWIFSWIKDFMDFIYCDSLQ